MAVFFSPLFVLAATWEVQGGHATLLSSLCFAAAGAEGRLRSFRPFVFWGHKIGDDLSTSFHRNRFFSREGRI